MRRAVSAREMRALEDAAIRRGFTLDGLMEAAGTAVAAHAAAARAGRVAVLCGPGNNGGDGLVAARHLAELGRDVQCEVVAPAATSLAKANLARLPSNVALRLNPSYGEGDVIIDAMFGIGVSRPMEAPWLAVVERIARFRAAGAFVLAVDVPSGLNADTGHPLGACVEADATLCLGWLKIGAVTAPGFLYAGDVRVAELNLQPPGVENSEAGSTFLAEESDARSAIPARSAIAHKGTAGNVLIVAGSRDKSGAAALAGMAALRAGAGLVTIACRADAAARVAAHAPELMVTVIPGSGALGAKDGAFLVRAAVDKDALVIGPGIPTGKGTDALVRLLVAKAKCPAVIDADALNALAAGKGGTLPKTAILTPHPGEAARLLHCTVDQVDADRRTSALDLARKWNGIAVLKGARTVIAEQRGTTIINPTGNAGLATAGTGDVLAGVIGALLASGVPLRDAAVAGVYVHGAAADACAARDSQRGLVASDLFWGLNSVWNKWGR